MQKFKVGDLVRLEGVITYIHNNGYTGVKFGGFSGTLSLLSPKEISHATLVEPEIKDAPQEQVKELDLSKPIQTKNGGHPVIYVGRLSNSKIIVESKEIDNPCWIYADFREDELENIPEPKKITAVLYLHEYADGSRFFSGYTATGTRISAARISHTEGEGWSIEEVK